MYCESAIIIIQYNYKRKMKAFSQKNARRCRDVKTQKVWEQSQEVNVQDPKLDKPLPYNPIKQNTKELNFCRVIRKCMRNSILCSMISEYTY